MAAAVKEDPAADVDEQFQLLGKFQSLKERLFDEDAPVVETKRGLIVCGLEVWIRGD